MDSYGKIALIVTSDQHINSTVALCKPVINLDDGGTYHASRTQRWLNDCWLDFCGKVSYLTTGYKRVGVFNGDLGELDTKKRSIQLITLNKATIQGMIIDTTEPLLAHLDTCYIMRGTSAHTGKSSWLEEAIGNDIDIAVRESEGAASWWHYRGLADRVRLDIAHHAPMGGKPWTRKNAANNLAALTMWHYRVTRDERAPHIVIRSHNHTKADSFDNFPTRAIFTPAWTTLTEFGYRSGFENELSEIGGTIILCDGEDYTIHKINYVRRERRIWALKM